MNLNLTQTQVTELRQLQRNATDRTAYIKVTVLLLLNKGLKAREVADYLGIDNGTVYRYRQEYEQEGLQAYLATHFKGYWGLLSSCQLSELRQELNTNLYTTTEQVLEWVQTRWGIKYTPSGMANLLKRIGYSYKQTTQVPCEADAQKQVAFMETLGPILTECADKESKAVVYFADAVHPTHNTRSTQAWIETGSERVQLTVSGRDRVNVNAVPNAHDPTDVFIEEGDRVNAQSTQALYKQVMAANPQAKTIYIIGDNARYYRNKMLTEWVQTTRIKPIFLPAYSPNLNLIERLWKFMRKKVINTSFYRRKSEFRAAVLGFFRDLGAYRTELESLLTLNFRLINSQSYSF